MPRIRLAYWHAGMQPGDETDVTVDELRDLQRDGRVAEVLGYEGGGVLRPGRLEPQPSPGPEAVDAPQPEPVPEGSSESGRKRR